MVNRRRRALGHAGLLCGSVAVGPVGGGPGAERREVCERDLALLPPKGMIEWRDASAAGRSVQRKQLESLRNGLEGVEANVAAGEVVRVEREQADIGSHVEDHRQRAIRRLRQRDPVPKVTGHLLGEEAGLVDVAAPGPLARGERDPGIRGGDGHERLGGDTGLRPLSIVPGYSST